ncbi:MAG: amino acid adenylation domain-containing protein, partial [bacterium]|nr:amino acid adenylation domain-containing protein [bacterium]
LPALPALADRAVCLDTGWAEISAQSTADPAPAATSSNLAYVIYTSGSTGQPKGSMIPHRGIVNRLLWMQQAYGLRPGEGVLQKTPFSFDVSVWEFFWPLVVGARLVVARPGGHQDSVYLAELVAERAVTTMHFVPSMLQVFVEEPRIDACGGLRRVIASGEALPHALQERFFSRLGAELHNLYGPTEASVDVTFWACERDGGGPGVPIGRPIANTEIYLLDRVGNPVPVGAAGELHIGGVGLARGYLGRPDLTAERFVPDPLSDDRSPGARLYRTGDLACFRPDGAIEFLGRIDYQLKLRGFRIELGEIEAVLGRSPQVRECVVVAREKGPGDLRLVAYVVVDGPAPELGLRAYLKESLPEYMVPATVVFLDSLPLTPNGKVDRAALGRRALPEPVARPELAGTRLAPRDTLELRLAQIWEDILDVRPTGVRDDFFALGGHSLQAVRLMARIEQELGRELPLTALFRSPTVEQLADLLRSEAEPAASSCLVAIQATGSKPPLFCVHPAGGNVLSFVPLAQELGPEQPFYALQSRGLENDQEPLATIEEMAARYVAELREVEPQGPYQLAGWSFGGLVAYEMACRLQADDQQVALLALFDTPAPVAGEAGPDARTFDDDAFWLADIANFLARVSGRELPLSYDELRQLAPEEQVGFFVERLREIDFLPPGTGVSQVHRLLGVYKTNIRASREYQPRPSDGRITLFRAAEGLAEDAAGSRETDLGWGGLCSAPVEVHTVPGDHITMLAKENLPVLTERLVACLERPASRRVC